MRTPDLTVRCTTEVSLCEPSFKQYHEPPLIDASLWPSIRGLLTQILVPWFKAVSGLPVLVKVGPANYITYTLEFVSTSENGD